MDPRERIAAIIDQDIFLEYDVDLETTDPLHFPA